MIERHPGGVPERRTASGLTRVKAHGAPARIDPEWEVHTWQLRLLVQKSIHVYTSTPHPGSTVVPWWMPTGLLISMLGEYDVPEAVVKATLDSLESDGHIEQRFMTIRGIVYPVACLTDDGRFGDIELYMHAEMSALLDVARRQIAPTRKEVGP